MRKNVLVTGATGGIGQAIALAFAQRGYGVGVHCCRRIEEARALAAAIREQGGNAFAYQADVADEGQVEAMAAAAQRDLGFVEVLVNNAGIAWKGLLTDMTLAEWRRVLDVNCTGAFLCCRAFLPAMIREKRHTWL